MMTLIGRNAPFFPESTLLTCQLQNDRLESLNFNNVKLSRKYAGVIPWQLRGVWNLFGNFLHSTVVRKTATANKPITKEEWKARHRSGSIRYSPQSTPQNRKK